MAICILETEGCGVSIEAQASLSAGVRLKYGRVREAPQAKKMSRLVEDRGRSRAGRRAKINLSLRKADIKGRLRRLSPHGARPSGRDGGERHAGAGARPKPALPYLYQRARQPAAHAVRVMPANAQIRPPRSAKSAESYGRPPATGMYSAEPASPNG